MLKEIDMEKRILVCITQQRACERLLDYGLELKNSDNDRVFLIHVVKNDWKYVVNDNSLEHLFEAATKRNIELTVIKGASIENTIALYAHKNEITDIVMGESLETQAQQNMINRVQEKTNRRYRFYVVETEPLNKPCSSRETVLI